MAHFKLIIVSLLLSLCILVPLTRANAVEFTYCDKEEVPSDYYDVKVQGVDIAPDPVPIGETSNFSISACSVKAIIGGKLTYEISHRGRPVLMQKIGLCEETCCPHPDFAIGDFVIVHKQNVDESTPTGNYKIKFRMEDETKRLRTCVAFDINIGDRLTVVDSSAELKKDFVFG